MEVCPWTLWRRSCYFKRLHFPSSYRFKQEKSLTTSWNLESFESLLHDHCFSDADFYRLLKWIYAEKVGIL